jgi:ABC-type amino acid transport substrate-binding protein
VQVLHLSRRALLAGSCLAWASGIAAADKPVGLRTDLGVWTDDWDGLLHRRVIRMLVPYSRTLFFQDRGSLYGVSVDGAQLLEAWINKTFKTGKRPLVVALIPTTRDQLFTDLLAGRGDIAAGDVSMTPARAKLVSFTVPTLHNVSEVLVTPAAAPRIDDASGLSGMEVAAREGTSFYESLQSLNKSLTEAGKQPVKISLVPSALETEDLMEMVAAGLLPAIVADDWVANLWTDIIPGLTVQKQVVLRSSGDIGWAVRPNNPKLLEVLNTAIAQVGGSAVQLSNRNKVYLHKLKQLHGATSKADIQALRRPEDDVREVRRQVWFRRSAAPGAGLPGIAPQPGSPQSGRRSWTDAAHAGDRRIHEGGRYPSGRAKRSCRRSVHAQFDRPLFSGRQIRYAEPYAVRLCIL